MVVRHEFEVAGRRFVLETGKLARQATAAVHVQYGETVVLATVTASKEPKELDFFPLTVNYEERLYAVGKIPGGFIKREGRPSEHAILASRLIDRPIRPLFPEGFRNDVQIVDLVLSVDQDCAPEIAAMIGTSASLTISDIPFNGPIGGVIVGLVDGQFVINPTVEQSEKSDLHLVVAGTKDAIVMVEAGANQVPEEIVLEAILYGHQVIQTICDEINAFAAKVGVKKREVELHKVDPELEAAVRAYATEKVSVAVRNPDKLAREEALANLNAEVLEHFKETFPEKEADIAEVMHTILKERVREAILREGIRPDGRRLDEIRPISCEVGLLPRTHGSALFTRGQTQALSVCTLGSMGDEQLLDGLEIEKSNRYMHHYNFPPFSVGEAKPLRAPSRRDIGHGALGERALDPVIPSPEEFPYAIRVVSEILESNGSTSQASICGSTMALMDAGVPIKAPVAGIAMGLVKEGDQVAILSDIQGIEDHLGDMDFKVAGTERGVTALQMDIKISGIDRSILERALKQAREGRMYILSKMMEAISEPRADLSKFAPRVITVKIHPDKIRDVIGPGGRVINKIIEETGVKIDIEQDGRVYIHSTDAEQANRAREMVENIVRDVEIGATYTGKVTRVEKYGAFVEILPGKEGLVHISQLDLNRVAKVEDVCQVGDTLTVKVTEIDNQGRINLSRKEVLKAMQPPAPPQPPRPSSGPGRGPQGGHGRRDHGHSAGPKAAPRRTHP
ncbi:polyribonucleotide nucleotidyltransferase [Alicyclobacillus acidocaldarius]|uniref:Polyribonucleotide nucleotidyltransferase n=1 Tax=Alicyclobacillus acidocaldarius (strain Tc-4-1) TaxID=1048834 RepID=F8III5_ALIAT|nr:polyribonucleotide nucleotidyltransferase [Alicyclobacillus acidocaldarius]AEJ43317.1 polyribonucleotide nucleotidyltransferase [Alicyclobacillus acidocaldarius subsp. acidocaldarius Tc-4-1]